MNLSQHPDETLADMLVSAHLRNLRPTSNQPQRVCAQRLVTTPSPHWDAHSFACIWQGGGVSKFKGTVNFQNCNIYDNTPNNCYPAKFSKLNDDCDNRPSS